jgi:hypothetical protein
VYVGGGSNFALSEPYGAGCYERRASWYETFANGTFDLSNSSLSLTFTGNGYVVLPGNATWFTPTSPNLGLTDDSVSAAQNLGFSLVHPAGVTTDVYVSSNGFVWGGPSTANGCCAGDVATLLATQPCWAANWGDLNPGAGGSVHFDTDPVAQAAYVTFVGVPEFGTQNLNDFQIAFFASGTVEYRYQNCMQANRVVLTGWSPGGGAVDPGSVDISASLPIQTEPDARGLAHGASARPVLGTTINLQTTNVPAGALVGSTLAGLTEITAGVDLTSLGMPGCFRYTSIEASTIWVPGGGSGSTGFSIPNQAALAGVAIKSQGVALVPGVNALGVLSSNGLRLTLNPN